MSETICGLWRPNCQALAVRVLEARRTGNLIEERHRTCPACQVGAVCRLAPLLGNSPT
jgi:hypothetical protein